MWRPLRSPIRFCVYRSRRRASWPRPVPQRRMRRTGRRTRRDASPERPSGSPRRQWREAQLAAAETALGSAISAEAKEEAEHDKAQAAARIAELQVQLVAAKAELQPKLDAVARTREAVVIAETARAAAAEAARQLAREFEPISVLISRKTQRLYVRQAFEPILESPVTIL